MALNEKLGIRGFPGTRTVYSRLLLSFSLIIVITMTVLGSLLSYFFKRQNDSERKTELLREAGEVNRIISEKYWPKDDRDVALEELDIIARKYNAFIQVYDKNGVITIIDPEKRADWEAGVTAIEDKKNDVVHNGFFAEILDGGVIQTTGYFVNTFDTPVMTIGRPLIISDQIQGAIFMHQKLIHITETIDLIYKNVLISAVAAVLAGVFMVALMSRRFTKPLTEMNEAARGYAKGDFSAHVKVSGDDEIGELAASLNTMADELSNLETMRSSFVANVSHELRAPISSIRGFAQVLLDGNTATPQETKEYLNIILDESMRMTTLISDLLDLSKIESGEFPIHKTMFDINDMLRRTLFKFESRIDDKSMEVELDMPDGYLVVEADVDRIEQVVTNLVDNAIKYCDNGGTISVSVRKAEEYVYVTVRDDGAGIPEEDLPHIFERFYKVEKAHTPGTEGTGLGLSIAKKIMDQHECELTCRSKLHKGTAFTFTLPLAMQQLKKKQSGADK